MEITLNCLYKGVGINVDDKWFSPTKFYVEDFINKMKSFTDKFRIEVVLAKQSTINQHKYNKVLIHAILPNCIDEYHETITLTYSVDTKIPVYKIYKSYYNNNTGHIVCFNRHWLFVEELLPKEKIKVTAVDVLLQLLDNIKAKIQFMKNNKLSTKETSRFIRIGSYIDKCFFLNWKNTIGSRISISPLDLVKVYHSVYIDQNSPFYVGDKDSTIFNMFEAMTQFIAADKKDIGNKLEKVFLVNQLMNL